MHMHERTPNRAYVNKNTKTLIVVLMQRDPNKGEIFPVGTHIIHKKRERVLLYQQYRAGLT